MNIKLEMSTYQWLKTLCVVSGITTSGCMPEMPVDGGTDTAGEASTDQETTETTGGTAPGGPTSTTETGVDSAGASNSGGDTTGTTGMEETSGVTDTSDSGESTTGDTPPMESCDPLPKYIDLNEIAAGKGGFALISEDDPNDMDGAFGNMGISVSDAGDVNGDGLADVVVGAVGLASNSQGRVYIVFGKKDTDPVDMKQIAAGIGGFSIEQAPGDRKLGYGVSEAGDVNGDGLDDVVVSESGLWGERVYVVFGKKNTQTVYGQDVLQGKGGFSITEDHEDKVVEINGVQTTTTWFFSSNVGGGGDVNGDGLDDLIVVSSLETESNQDDNAITFSSWAYVVLGKKDTFPMLATDLEKGVGGYVIEGQNFENLGIGFDVVGDVNGDSLDDIALSAPVYTDDDDVDPPYLSRVYVALGKKDTNNVYTNDLAIGKGGYMYESDNPGFQAFNPEMKIGGAGDVNGDGYADIIFSSGSLYFMDEGWESTVYVALGKPNNQSTTMSQLAAGNGGWAIKETHWAWSTKFGRSVNGGGDFDGDGYDDMIIGSLSIDEYENDLQVPGSAYVMYGKGEPPNLTVDDLDAGIGGFRMDLDGKGGTRTYAGYSVDLAGDVNGDGYPDWIVGSPGALKDQFDVDLYHPARTYIVFGGCGQPKPG